MFITAGIGTLILHFTGFYAFARASEQIVRWRGSGRANPFLLGAWGTAGGLLLAYVHG